MTSRERELAAIKHLATDRIPVDVICVENTLALFETAISFRGKGYTKEG